MPHPLLPLFLSQKGRIAVQVVEAPRLSMTIFLFPCEATLAQWSASWLCSLWTYFTKMSVFEIGLAISLFHNVKRVFWIFTIVSLYFCPLGKFAIDPLACHITVSALLHSGSCTTCMNWINFGSQTFGCLFLKPLFFVFLFVFSVRSVDSFILFRTEVTNLYFSSGVFSFSLQQSSLPCPPNTWASYPTHFHNCAISINASISFFIVLVCRECAMLSLPTLEPRVFAWWKCGESVQYVLWHNVRICTYCLSGCSVHTPRRTVEHTIAAKIITVTNKK